MRTRHLLIVLVSVGLSSLASAAEITLVADHGQDCGGTVKVCMPEPTKVITTKIVYAARQVDFCLPKATVHGLSLHLLHDSCSTCAVNEPCPECGHPHTKNVLLKKAVTEECDDFKCTAVEVPASQVSGHGLLRIFGH